MVSKINTTPRIMKNTDIQGEREKKKNETKNAVLK